MRIAYVIQDPGVRIGGSKGASVHVDAMCTAFRALGAEVEMVRDPCTDVVREALEALHAAGRLDMVYERYSLGGVGGGRFARAAHVPHVLEVNAPLEDEAREHRPASLALLDVDAERAVFEHATLVVAVSTPVAEYARARGAGSERVVVEPNGVDPARFTPRRDAELRARLAPEHAFVIGFHGRLRPWHRLDRLALATRELRALGVPAHLLCVGLGDFRATLTGALADAAWTHVPWVPHADVARYVACFDALPLTYASGAYFSPLKLTEAMAAGVPAVVPDVADLTDVVEHGRNGLVYPATNDAALVEGLRRLAEDSELRHELGRAARASAEQRTWTAIARRVLQAGSGALA